MLALTSFNFKICALNKKGRREKREVCKTTTKEKNDDYDFARDSFFLFCTKKITRRTNKKFCSQKARNCRGSAPDSFLIALI